MIQFKPETTKLMGCEHNASERQPARLPAGLLHYAQQKNVQQPRPARTGARKHSPHRAVGSGAHRRQVLVPLRNLPHGLVQLLPIESRSGGHGSTAEKDGDERGRERRRRRGGGRRRSAAAGARTNNVRTHARTHAHGPFSRSLS